MQESESKHHSLRSAIQEFLQLESTGGLLVLAATVLALLIANSPLVGGYEASLEVIGAVQVGALVVEKPLLLWINDGLMAVFFFLVGLELKRELLEGELSSPRRIALPLIGAAGGLIVPAIIYVALNWHNQAALDAWAIPVATDIAFVLALLTIFGRRVPVSLKVFVLGLAIFDDIAAILIIAIFYSSALSLTAVLVGAALLAIAVGMNRLGVTRISSYVFIGVLLWVAVLKSGVHATLAGILVALCIPMRNEQGSCPLRDLEHDLHFPVAYIILPMFAFANAGMSLSDMTLGSLLEPVALGIWLGLFVGKPLGIMAFIGVAVLCGFVQLPRGTNWFQMLGVACACGIGFTMSLFIAGLAIQHGSEGFFDLDHLGVLVGSVLSAVCAALILHLSLKPLKPSTQARGLSPSDT